VDIGDQHFQAACDSGPEAHDIAATVWPTASRRPEHSYGQILNSSVLIGGSSLIVVLLTMLRTKVLALRMLRSLPGRERLAGSVADPIRRLRAAGVRAIGFSR
jgi:hypothetical protein